MTLKSRYKLIIFDCDGTLVDTEQLLNTACSQALVSLGFIKYTPSYCLNNFIGKNLISIIEIVKSENNNQDNSWVREFTHRCSVIAPQLLENQVKPIQYVSEVLEKLSTMDKCVASNGSRECVLLSLKTAQLLKYFKINSIYTHELVANPKPAPDLFLYAAEQFGCKPSECLVIEDSLVGTAAAIAAGIDVLVYRSHHSEQNHQMSDSINKLKVTGIIKDLRQIFDYL